MNPAFKHLFDRINWSHEVQSTSFLCSKISFSQIQHIQCSSIMHWHAFCAMKQFQPYVDWKLVHCDGMYDLFAFHVYNLALLICKSTKYVLDHEFLHPQESCYARTVLLIRACHGFDKQRESRFQILANSYFIHTHICREMIL